jgi:hypothetical protein
MNWVEQLSHALRRRARGPYVSCWSFVVGVMDELHGIALPLPRALPTDLAFNRPMEATRAVVRMLRRYPHTKVDGEIEPGDLVLVRVTKGVGHALIAGPTPNTLWHCDVGGVWYTGVGPWKSRIVRVVRSLCREDWRARL